MLKTAIIAVAFSVGLAFNLKWSLRAITGIEAIFLIFTLLKRPYNSVLMSLGGYICQLMTIYALSIPLMKQFY
jgi:hypothetical protein